MSNVSAYTDLAQRMANDFADIENDILAAYRKESPDYAELCQQLKNIKTENPVIKLLVCFSKSPLTNAPLRYIIYVMYNLCYS